MKELPNKWCFTTTKESQDVFLNWYFNKKYGGRISGIDISIGNHYCVDVINDKIEGWMYYAPERKNGYTEISFEDFQRLVLGINVEKGYELW